MATQGTYYFDTASFTNATAVFSDSNLSTLAPDGFYSNGTVSRQQVSGVLLPEVVCPDCTPTPVPVPVPVPIPTPVPFPVAPTPVPVPVSPTPVPTTPTPVPVPTTPTPVPIAPSYTYYFAQPCGGGSTVYFRSTSYYSPGESVKISGYGDTCFEVGSPGAPINSNDVTSAFPDCEACSPTPVPVPVPVAPTPVPVPVAPTPVPVPVAPTPTPTPVPVAPSYNYYFAQPCGGGTTIYMRSVTTFSPGESFKLSGDSTCYEVGASGAPINSNDPVEAFPDCSGCLPSPTPIPTPVPVAPTPVPVPVPVAPTPVPVPVAPTPVPSPPVSVTEGGITASETNGSTTDNQCFQLLSSTAYYEGDFVTDATKLDGRWFVDDNGTNPFDGDFKWYGVGTTSDFAATYQVQISGAGIVVAQRAAC